MAKIGLFFGTQTGNTEEVAEKIQEEIENFGEEVEATDIADAEVSDFDEFEYLILGTPTWNYGDLQDDWDEKMDELDDYDFSGKKIALFGLGDQDGYSENFIDGIGILGKKIKEKGGTLYGYTSTDGYEYDESVAVEDGKFMGLAIDEDNQSDMTDDRVSAWVEQVLGEFGLM